MTKRLKIEQRFVWSVIGKLWVGFRLAQTNSNSPLTPKIGGVTQDSPSKNSRMVTDWAEFDLICIGKLLLDFRLAKLFDLSSPTKSLPCGDVTNARNYSHYNYVQLLENFSDTLETFCEFFLLAFKDTLFVLSRNFHQFNKSDICDTNTRKFCTAVFAHHNQSALVRNLVNWPSIISILL